MLLIDLEQGRIVSDDEIKKAAFAEAHPYKEWLKRARRSSSRSCELPESRQDRRARQRSVPLLDRQQAFGYTQEDL